MAIFLLAAGLTLAARCGKPPIVIEAPRDGALFEDPLPSVAAAARLSNAIDPGSVAVELGGVDLVAALGLLPPFSDESGVVQVGVALVTITGFSFTPLGSGHRVELVASGLDEGLHSLAVSGLKASAALVSRSVEFRITGPMTLEVEALTAAGTPPGLTTGAEGTLANAALAQPLAAGPVGLVGGGELRGGLVPVAEARIAGGAP